MEITDLKDLYTQSLGVAAPWKVQKVTMLGNERRVEVYVECEKGTVWTDPETRERGYVHGWKERTWRHLDTCEFETVVIAKVPRIVIGKKGDDKPKKTMTVTVPWAEKGGRFTKRMEQFLVFVLLQCPAVSRAASLAKITVDQAEGVMSRAVERGLSRRTVQIINTLGIDEKALRKYHRYATLLYDIERGTVYEVGEKRTKEAAAKLIRELPEEIKKNIEAVTLDMSKAYIGAVKEELAEAFQIFDKFHIAAKLNEVVNKVRAAEHKKLKAKGDESLKGSKHSWMKTKIDGRTKAGIEFRKIRAKDLRTSRAWSLKESFKHFWTYKTPSRAMRFLSNWLEEAYESGIRGMEKFAKMIDEHMAGVLNYIYKPATNAAAEGLNTSIQALRVAARGLPNFENFRSRILFHHGKLDLAPAA